MKVTIHDFSGGRTTFDDVDGVVWMTDSVLRLGGPPKDGKRVLYLHPSLAMVQVDGNPVRTEGEVEHGQT